MQLSTYELWYDLHFLNSVMSFQRLESKDDSNLGNKCGLGFNLYNTKGRATVGRSSQVGCRIIHFSGSGTFWYGSGPSDPDLRIRIFGSGSSDPDLRIRIFGSGSSDPDLPIRIFGSVPLTNGFGSGSYSFYQRPSSLCSFLKDKKA
jgi:hypothetical protein